MIRVSTFALCFILSLSLFPSPCAATGYLETTANAVPASSAQNSSKSSQGADRDISWWQRLGQRINQTWHSPTWDMYVPLHTWHNRYTYDKSKTDEYNETPWGFGIGKSMFDEDGDWHALYAMGFQDSHNMFEPITGYAFQKNWRPSGESDWRFGAGFITGITARQQYNYVPLPLALPMAGVEYKRAALQAVYIPGTYNNGNVLFCWLRWQLN